ncbi:hypothetical protein CAPN002_25830 [Capnocytophaga stomatis]|uniref:hypothetical protein n=1 Tax=Capnocytophaga stomatis TaxID=1848904 RepID=UPI001951563C|nr:hypothetical protein [Capnocytophaga stomatis]GIJ95365.1 hypothetical protein CAPN002_25830 [Capnocytophaga stomatis]
MKKLFEKIGKGVKKWKWARENPKKFYFYSIGILFTLLILNVALEILYNNKKTDKNFLLPLYKKSETIIKKEEKREEDKQKRMVKIIKELEILKEKREDGSLTSNDSIRIEFLYNQYQNIKNEK